MNGLKHLSTNGTKRHEKQRNNEASKNWFFDAIFEKRHHFDLIAVQFEI